METSADQAKQLRTPPRGQRRLAVAAAGLLINILVASLPLAATADDEREHEANRLYVEAAKVTWGSGCEDVYGSFEKASVTGFDWWFQSGKRERATISRCLESYRPAAVLYDRLLDEYPDTKAATLAVSENRIGASRLNALIAEASKATDMQTARGQLPNYQVTRVQKDLMTLGFDPGPADGQMGAKTKAAIEAYQRKKGLDVDGQITGNLTSALTADITKDMLDKVLAPTSRLSKAAEIARLSDEEMEGLRQQISGCIRWPSNASKGVQIELMMGPDGSVLTSNLSNPWLMMSPEYVEMAVSASNAFRDPQCMKLKLPAEKFAAWQHLSVTINPASSHAGVREGD